MTECFDLSVQLASSSTTTRCAEPTAPRGDRAPCSRSRSSAHSRSARTVRLHAPRPLSRANVTHAVSVYFGHALHLGRPGHGKTATLHRFQLSLDGTEPFGRRSYENSPVHYFLDRFCISVFPTLWL
jgi:hypothetical protein